MKKTMIVFGAGKGIGKTTSDLAYKKGYEIIAISRDESDLRNRPYHVIALDVEPQTSVSDLKNLDLELYGNKIDVIINCTGTHLGEQIICSGWNQSVMSLMEKNFRPALNLYEVFLPKLRERKCGHFIHISSTALDFYNGPEAGYIASKAALEGLVLSLQSEDEKLKSSVMHHAVRVSLTDTPLARSVCPAIKDWSSFYTVEETAAYLINIVEKPENYPKTIVRLPYRPLR